jgi:hypothetical protein
MRKLNLLRVTTRAKLALVKTQAYSNLLVLPTAAGIFKASLQTS